MARIRRLAGVAGACALATAVVAGPASAKPADVYAGSAKGTALELSVLNNKATFGVTTAEVSSQLIAKATGAGQLVPQLTAFAGNQEAAVEGAGAVTKPEKCATPSLPAPVSAVLSIGAACSEVSASVVGELPSAASAASVAQIDVNAQTALDALGAVTTPIQTNVNNVLTQLCNAVAATCPVDTTVKDLIASILDTKTLEIAAGTSSSKVTTQETKVVSEAEAAGAVIKLLPLPQVNGLPSTDPVATIYVGHAKARSVYDQASGDSSASFDPALVRIVLNTVATGNTEIKVPVGQSITILQGTPLESTITAAAGRQVKNADGSVGAVADAVRLELLKGLNGGIVLGLARAEAGVGASNLPAPPRVIETPRELPRTGGTPWVPFTGAGLLGLAVLVRRTLLRAGN